MVDVSNNARLIIEHHLNLLYEVALYNGKKRQRSFAIFQMYKNDIINIFEDMNEASRIMGVEKKTLACCIAKGKKINNTHLIKACDYEKTLE